MPKKLTATVVAVGVARPAFAMIASMWPPVRLGDPGDQLTAASAVDRSTVMSASCVSTPITRSPRSVSSSVVALPIPLAEPVTT